MANETHTTQRLKKMRKRKAKPFATVITTGLSVSSGLMLGFAVPNLIGADSGLDFAKAILLAGSGALVSLGVNRLAVEKGAVQAAIGTAGAPLVSTVSMLAVGAGLFAATYSGLVIKDVDALRQQEFGTEYAEFIDFRNQKAIEAGRAAPVMRAIVSDLTAKEACESETSCISGRGIMGKPKALGVDNGADFHAKAFERGCTQHGIKIDWRPPGQPQFGGVIERIIGTLMMRIHQLPGTTFSNTAQRGKYNNERRACLTLEELEKWLTLVICKDYHQSPHRGIDKETPMMRLNKGLAALKKAENGPIIPQDLHGYLIDFLPIYRRTLQRDGFTIDHIRYFSNALKPWISSRDARVQGSMILRRDPRDLSRIYVLDPFDNVYIEVPFRTLSRPAITLWEHRAATRRARERTTSQVNEEMIFTAFEEMQEIERNAVRLSKKARRRKARPQFKQPPNDATRNQAKERSEQSPPSSSSAPRPFSDIEEW